LKNLIKSFEQGRWYETFAAVRGEDAPSMLRDEMKKFNSSLWLRKRYAWVAAFGELKSTVYCNGIFMSNRMWCSHSQSKWHTQVNSSRKSQGNHTLLQLPVYWKEIILIC